MAVRIKSVLLTFDLEEFDLIYHSDKHRISYNGTIKILKLIDSFGIKATFFTTAEYALKYPKLIENIDQQGHEIACHGYDHTHNYRRMPPQEARMYLKEAKNILGQYTQDEVLGFRAPRMQFPDYKIIKQANYLYDSSYHPTFVPGMYNGFFGKRSPFESAGIKVLPISVVPALRLPLSWIWFRNLGLRYAVACSKLALLDQDNINIYFHPWEFENMKDYPLNIFIKRNTGEKMLSGLTKYMNWCMAHNFKFRTIKDYLFQSC